MKDRGLYYLMHRDDIVTAVEIDPVSGNMLRVSSQVRRELLPPGGNLSQDDLRGWWGRRSVPATQGMIQKILTQKGFATTQSFLAVNLGLSLSDHYWIRPLDSDLTWGQVNLYENAFRDDIGDLIFPGKIETDEKPDLTDATVFYPSASTQGELQKKWIIALGKRCLVKGNYGDSFQQSVNEVIATALHERQRKAAYTQYRLCEIGTDGGRALGCICENFTSVDVEFIPAFNVVSSVKKNNDMSEFEHFIAVCEKNGLAGAKVRKFLEYQILSDFILTNTDRHFNNFGVLRDTKTLTYIDMAPIFDTGNSMFWNNTSLPLHDSLLQIPVTSFRKKETDLLRYISNFQTLDLTRLPPDEEVFGLLKKANLSEHQIEGVITGYRRKKNCWESFRMSHWGRFC